MAVSVFSSAISPPSIWRLRLCPFLLTYISWRAKPFVLCVPWLRSRIFLGVLRLPQLRFFSCRFPRLKSLFDPRRHSLFRVPLRFFLPSSFGALLMFASLLSLQSIPFFFLSCSCTPALSGIYKPRYPPDPLPASSLDLASKSVTSFFVLTTCGRKKAL